MTDEGSRNNPQGGAGARERMGFRRQEQGIVGLELYKDT